MSMMIHRAVLRQREKERQLAEKPAENKAPVTDGGVEKAPPVKRGRKTKR